MLHLLHFSCAKLIVPYSPTGCKIPMVLFSVCLHHAQHLQHPIHKSQHPAAEDSIKDYRSCNLKNLTAYAKDLPLPFCQVWYKKNLKIVFPGGEYYSPHGKYAYSCYLLCNSNFSQNIISFERYLYLSIVRYINSINDLI